MKKLAAALLVGVFTFSVVPVMTTSVVYAAKGGARISAPKSAPRVAPSTNSAAPKTNNYAPSKSAKDLSKEAPAASTKANANTNTNTSSSRWGSALRNIGIFAGGMMLGHLLTSSLGFGSGMMSDIMGLLMNVLLLAAAFVVIRLLWNKFRGRKDSGNPYQQRTQDSVQRSSMTDITPPDQRIQDIRPPQQPGEDARSTADRYRNR